LAGHEVAIFNRDVKPGGLAEYGIYPLEHKMKDGLRQQFTKILALPNVHYFGHVPVGAHSAIPIEELRQFNPAALVFAVGAQGTKRLGMAGENAGGVYSAKDFVYHYNLLPPFASQDFSTGKRIAVVGMGNVMVDIARDRLRRSAPEAQKVGWTAPFGRAGKSMQLPRSAGLVMIGLGIGMRGNWTKWLRRTPKTQFIFRRTTRRFTDAMPFESI
jgi:NADPH-dependent glutamate synthase beta subunit-like oxidoreductase